MAKGKTVTLKLRSKLGEEEFDVPEKLWLKFERRATELKISVEELFIIVLKIELDLLSRGLN
jgi:hypothetical protein